MTQARDLADGKFDTNTLVVDAANNRVGVGTTSPQRDLEINGTAANSKAFTRYTHGGLASTGLDVGYSSGGYASIYNAENTATVFSTNATERLRILAGGGLTFNGDTAATNALDDYEEGTWDPSADSNITFTGTPSGTYIKVGNLVTVFDSLTCSLTSGQEFIIGGLPYAPAAGNEPIVLILNNGSTFNYVPRGRTDTNSQIKGRSPATVSGINLMIQGTYHV